MLDTKLKSNETGLGWELAGKENEEGEKAGISAEGKRTSEGHTQGRAERKGKGDRNGVNYGLFAAVALTVIFSLIFYAQYPIFQKNAQRIQQDRAQNSNSLTMLEMGNYIFFKDIVEKVEQDVYSYSDLYVKLEVEVEGEFESREKYEEHKGKGEYRESALFMEEDIDLFAARLSERVNEELQINQSVIMAEVARLMDYCVIDHKTGQFIKNTERKIETLAGDWYVEGSYGMAGGVKTQQGGMAQDAAGTGEEAMQGQAQEEYVYYVAVSYDSVGNLDQTLVKGEDSDELLKRVQNVMRTRILENRMEELDGLYGAEGSVSGYSAADDCIKTVHYRLGSPHDVTFIYAMTKEQMQIAIDSGRLEYNWDSWYSYYQSGVVDVLNMMLLMLAVLVLILTHGKWYGLHRGKASHIPLEISIAALCFWFIGGVEWMVRVVESSCMGRLSAVYAKYVSFLPTDAYGTVTFLLNFVALAVLFGGWIYVVNSFGGIWSLGIGGFLRERSIALKLVMGGWNWMKEYCNRFKQEMLHVDLDETAMKMVRKTVFLNFLLIGGMCSMWVFGWTALLLYSIALYFILKKYVKRIQMQYGKMLEATNSIAEGNLYTVFDEDLGIFESYKEELYRIQEGLRKAVDEEVKSQRMKTELITNVSHDLKTPLTAITTYIDLLKGEDITQGQREEYLAVLEKKSLRLKTLIEDLFEVSKANSRNVTVNLVEVDICNLMRQAYLEYGDQVEEAKLIFRFRMPKEKVVLKLDSQKTYRIFENLYTNIIKYAMPGSRVYVELETEEDGVRIELKNMSAMELHVEADELTERFVRGDSSRNTEGSGLGLAIAKSFAQLQGGKMEVTVDGDLFKVALFFSRNGCSGQIL